MCNKCTQLTIVVGTLEVGDAPNTAIVFPQRFVQLYTCPHTWRKLCRPTVPQVTTLKQPSPQHHHSLLYWLTLYLKYDVRAKSEPTITGLITTRLVIKSTAAMFTSLTIQLQYYQLISVIIYIFIICCDPSCYIHIIQLSTSIHQHYHLHPHHLLWCVLLHSHTQAVHINTSVLPSTSSSSVEIRTVTFIQSSRHHQHISIIIYILIICCDTYCYIHTIQLSSSTHQHYHLHLHHLLWYVLLHSYNPAVINTSVLPSTSSSSVVIRTVTFIQSSCHQHISIIIYIFIICCDTYCYIHTIKPSSSTHQHYHLHLHHLLRSFQLHSHTQAVHINTPSLRWQKSCHQAAAPGPEAWPWNAQGRSWGEVCWEMRVLPPAASCAHAAPSSSCLSQRQSCPGLGRSLHTKPILIAVCQWLWVTQHEYWLLCASDCESHNMNTAVCWWLWVTQHQY